MNGVDQRKLSSASLLKFGKTLEMERRIATEIMDVVHKLQLPLKLDKLTRGEGNCFPLAVLQQCKRTDIFSYLRPAIKRFVHIQDSHSVLRREVRKFIMKSKTHRIAQFRTQYEETDGPANKETWDRYWERMVVDKTWVDFWFIQATAWYLQLDMWIITTSSTDNSPYIEISGNLDEGGIPYDRPILILGTKSNCHYQSLLPIEVLYHQDFPGQETTGLQMTNNARKQFNEMATPARQPKEGLKNSSNSINLDLPVPNLTDDKVTDDEWNEIQHGKNFKEMAAPAFVPARQPKNESKKSSNSMKQDLPVPDLTDYEITDDDVTDNEEEEIRQRLNSIIEIIVLLSTNSVYEQGLLGFGILVTY